MSVRVYLAIGDRALRRRLATLLKVDPEIRVVTEQGAADLVVADSMGHPVAAEVGDPATEGASLTARELEVLRLMAEGLANKEIAADLGISRHTAKYHVASIMTKLDAHSRAEAVSRGLRLGLVPL